MERNYERKQGKRKKIPNIYYKKQNIAKEAFGGGMK